MVSSGAGGGVLAALAYSLLVAEQYADILLLHAVLCLRDMGAGYGNGAVHENVVLFQQLHVNADLPAVLFSTGITP